MPHLTRHVDDRAATRHYPGYASRNPERRPDIEGDQPVQRFVGNVNKRFGLIASGIVHEEVEWIGILDRHEQVITGDVDFPCREARPQFGLQCRQFGRWPRDTDYLPAFREKGAADFATEAFARAGDECPLLCQNTSHRAFRAKLDGAVHPLRELAPRLPACRRYCADCAHCREAQ